MVQLLKYRRSDGEILGAFEASTPELLTRQIDAADTEAAYLWPPVPLSTADQQRVRILQGKLVPREAGDTPPAMAFVGAREALPLPTLAALETVLAEQLAQQQAQIRGLVAVLLTLHPDLAVPPALQAIVADFRPEASPLPREG
jgi:hypothetical protein